MSQPILGSNPELVRMCLKVRISGVFLKYLPIWWNSWNFEKVAHSQPLAHW
jgi:hypothetical protein